VLQGWPIAGRAMSGRVESGFQGLAGSQTNQIPALFAPPHSRANHRADTEVSLHPVASRRRCSLGQGPATGLETGPGLARHTRLQVELQWIYSSKMMYKSAAPIEAIILIYFKFYALAPVRLRSGIGLACAHPAWTPATDLDVD
jgi:hypothetical protein